MNKLKVWKIEDFGCFVFKHEGDGCLSGKYFNNGGLEPLSESCKKTGNSDEIDHFIGEFTSAWIDTKGGTDNSLLSIEKIKSGIYKLEWKRANGVLVFHGRGMIYGDILVGNYWDE